MTKIITGENQFQILAHSFSVSPSNEGYTLNYSADGVNFSAWPDATPANDTLVVNGIGKNMWFRLNGNASNVTITY